MKRHPHLARLYAKAFYDATGGRQELAPLLPHLKAVGAQLAAPGLAIDAALTLLGNPQVPKIRRLVTILHRRKRLWLLDEIIATYARIREEERGIRRVAVTAAFDLPASLRERIARLLAEHLAATEVILETTVDPTLIGGMTIRIGDTVIDGSVRATLERFQKRFARD